MLRIDRSMAILPGKTAEALKHARRSGDYLSEHTSVTAPVQVMLEVLGNVGRLHILIEYENLAAYEDSLATLRGIPGIQWSEMLKEGEKYYVPGSVHDVAMVSEGTP